MRAVGFVDEILVNFGRYVILVLLLHKTPKRRTVNSDISQEVISR
jgi:hypothetical protein